MLEKQLDQVDELETKELFLGSQRRDLNQCRKVIMKRIDEAIADYGKAELCVLIRRSFLSKN